MYEVGGEGNSCGFVDEIDTESRSEPRWDISRRIDTTRSHRQSFLKSCLNRSQLFWICLSSGWLAKILYPYTPHS